MSMRSKKSIEENVAEGVQGLEKEILDFVYRQWHRNPGVEVPMTEVRQAFAEIDEDDFGDRCTALALEGLLSSNGGKTLTLGPKGVEMAERLFGKKSALQLVIDQEPEKPADTGGDDLFWNISNTHDPIRSYRFFEALSRSVSVYSATARALYTNYSLRPVHGKIPTLNIVPNLGDEHDTYYSIAASTVVPTRSFIRPDGNGGYQLQIIGGKGATHVLPLREGLDLMQGKLGEAPLLPVLIQGSLRDLEPGVPGVLLHRLVLEKVTGHPDMELRSLRRAIQSRLADNFGFKVLAAKLFV